jgi:hypothetical protein
VKLDPGYTTRQLAVSIPLRDIAKWNLIFKFFFAISLHVLFKIKKKTKIKGKNRK